ncbi:MAG: hypothetical protein V1726_07185 [Methanobacteriota archaeon]
MKQKREADYQKNGKKYGEDITTDDIIQLCIEKGLIEKTEYGYYFKREFFETLDLYNA